MKKDGSLRSKLKNTIRQQSLTKGKAVFQKGKEKHLDLIYELEDIYIETEDFQKTSKRVQSSTQREGFSTVHNTSMSDVVALVNIRAELQMSIIEPVMNPLRFL